MKFPSFVRATVVACTSIAALSAFASTDHGLVLGAPLLQESVGKTLVTVQITNSGSSDIAGARAWVFIENSEGKVVGNHAQWIIGKDTGTDALPPGKSKEFKVAVPGTGATHAKVVFSRVILAGGNTAKSPE